MTPRRAGSIPERLRYLQATVRFDGTEPYPVPAIAAWAKNNGYKISPAHIYAILTARRPQPSHPYLQALAAFYAVDAATTFYAEEPPELDGVALATQITLRDDPAACRMVEQRNKLSPPLQNALSDVVTSLLAAEGVRLPGQHDDAIVFLLNRYVLLSSRSRDALASIVANLLQGQVPGARTRAAEHSDHL